LCIALYGKPIAELRSFTYRMELHTVACHPIEMNASRFNLIHTGRYATPQTIVNSTFCPSAVRRDGRLSWLWL